MKHFAEFVVVLLTMHAASCLFLVTTNALFGTSVTISPPALATAGLASLALAGLIAAVLECARALDRGNGGSGR